jgi:hypothetical protein
MLINSKFEAGVTFEWTSRPQANEQATSMSNGPTRMYGFVGAIE